MPAEARDFFFSTRVQTGSGAHPASYSMCTHLLPLGVKRQGRGVGHLPISNAEVNQGWICISAPPDGVDREELYLF